MPAPDRVSAQRRLSLELPEARPTRLLAETRAERDDGHVAMRGEELVADPGGREVRAGTGWIRSESPRDSSGAIGGAKLAGEGVLGAVTRPLRSCGPIIFSASSIAGPTESSSAGVARPTRRGARVKDTEGSVSMRLSLCRPNPGVSVYCAGGRSHPGLLLPLRGGETTGATDAERRVRSTLAVRLSTDGGLRRVRAGPRGINAGTVVRRSARRSSERRVLRRSGRWLIRALEFEPKRASETRRGAVRFCESTIAPNCERCVEGRVGRAASEGARRGAGGEGERAAVEGPFDEGAVEGAAVDEGAFEEGARVEGSGSGVGGAGGRSDAEMFVTAESTMSRTNAFLRSDCSVSERCIAASSAAGWLSTARSTAASTMSCTTSFRRSDCSVSERHLLRRRVRGRAHDRLERARHHAVHHLLALKGKYARGGLGRPRARRLGRCRSRLGGGRGIDRRLRMRHPSNGAKEPFARSTREAVSSEENSQQSTISSSRNGSEPARALARCESRSRTLGELILVGNQCSYFDHV